MKCPEPIREIVTALLRHGILQARAAAWSGDCELCAALTDHLHNLPDLLSNFSEDRLIYYWEVERPTFINSVSDEVSSSYLAVWEQLRAHGRLSEPAATEC